ncbi:hypothetical protein HZA87_01750 [Candidatus Uhrbacteria bacterium]|nr:hypothetical protein [Candidatus Uhrbacteria bacterium]
MIVEHESHSVQKEHEWLRQQEVISKILDHGMEAYVDQIPDLEQAFDSNEHTLCCMDEGVALGDLRSAGSGILTQGAERAAFIAKLKAAGVKDIMSHEGCGAAGLYRDRHGITDKTVDEVAIEQTQKIARELGVPYKGHVTELDRPKEFHNARVVYVDGTGRFNPSRVPGLPQGFVVSARFMTPEQALSEVQLAIHIAFGEHGFGGKFTQDDPLVVVAIGDSTASGFSGTDLQRELQTILGEKRIRVDQFSVPRIGMQEAA